MKKYAKLLRVKHYLKNGLVFLPIIFNGSLFVKDKLISVILGFIVFSLLASVVYIINDIMDLENDRKHPTKCRRPIASGAIPVLSAKIIALLLLIAATTINICLSKNNLYIHAVLLLYVATNFWYSKGAKNVALLDIFILAIGYILRLYYGALIIDVEVSSWMYLTILTMSFYLGMGKRRNELKKTGDETRKVLKIYNEKFLDKNMYMCLTAAVLFYSLWCESMTQRLDSQLILCTVPLVFLICMRYSLLIEKGGEGDPIEVVTGDTAICLMVAGFVLAIGLILYLPK